jgi:uncharacterized damage-inducible protein DinB
MWHGPALSEVLAGVSHQQASVRPIAGAHTIWEIVVHITGWAEITRARIHGERTEDPTPEQDWPSPPAATAEAWIAAAAALEDSYRTLAADIVAIDDDVFDRKVSTLEYTLDTLLHGVVEHGTYHGGQIALLKKAAAE